MKEAPSQAGRGDDQEGRQVIGNSCQLLKSSCWAYEGAATSTAAAMKDERIAEGVKKIIKSCKVSETSSLAAPAGGVYRLQCSALQPRLQQTIGSSVAGRYKLLLPLPCSAEIGRTILSRLPADHQAPRHWRRTRGGP